jgi:hypothetical protein
MALLGPPGSIDDFDRRPAMKDAYAAAWDHWLRTRVEKRATKRQVRFGLPQLEEPRPPAAPVTWDAFPRLLTRWFQGQPDEERWRVAEVLDRVSAGTSSTEQPVIVLTRQQDEYCEWFVRRNAQGEIDRIDFTSEGPEYWEFLANGTDVLFRGEPVPPGLAFPGDLTLVHDLYREFVDPQVQLDDLRWDQDVFDGVDKIHLRGEYNRWNKWNTTHGAMHLTHGSNTLFAEIALAADAMIVREVDGDLVTDVDALVCCSGFGDPNRSSDPVIGAAVNGLARAGNEVALADPIGLYISQIDQDAFFGPAGWSFDDAWDHRRGDGQRTLRISLVGSKDGSVKVGDIQAQNAPIAFGGQVADAIQMVLFGEAHGPQQTVTTRGCDLVCCVNGQRPLRAIVPPGFDCDQIDWSKLGPETQDAIDEAFGLSESVAPVKTIHRDGTRAG